MNQQPCGCAIVTMSTFQTVLLLWALVRRKSTHIYGRYKPNVHQTNWSWAHLHDQNHIQWLILVNPWCHNSSSKITLYTEFSPPLEQSWVKKHCYILHVINPTVHTTAIEVRFGQVPNQREASYKWSHWWNDGFRSIPWRNQKNIPLQHQLRGRVVGFLQWRRNWQWNQKSSNQNRSNLTSFSEKSGFRLSCCYHTWWNRPVSNGRSTFHRYWPSQKEPKPV